MTKTDLTGNRYGMLTVVEYIEKNKWRCRCDCGNETIALSGNLKRLHTKSCGCLRFTDKYAAGNIYKNAEVLSKDKTGLMLKCKCGSTFHNTWSNISVAKELTCIDCSKKRAVIKTKAKIAAGEINPVAKPIHLKLRIAEIRKEKNVTQKDLAAAIGTTRSKISDMERGHQRGENLTLGNAVKISQFLEVSIEELFEIEG